MRKIIFLVLFLCLFLYADDQAGSLGSGSGSGTDTGAIARDGSRPPTADIDWANFAITGLDRIIFDNGLQTPALLEHGGNNRISTTAFFDSTENITAEGFILDDGINPSISLSLSATGLSFGSAKLEDLVNPVNGQDAVTLNYLSSNYPNVTLDVVGSSPNANAASLSGQVLNLEPFSSAFPGVVSASGGGTTNFLRADGTWAAPSSGGITELTGDVTAGPGSGSQAATISANAVTNTKLADMATQTIKGRTTAGTGDPEDLTATQVRTLLGVPLSTAVMLLDGSQAMTGDMSLGNQDLLNALSFEVDGGSNLAPFILSEPRSDWPTHQAQKTGSEAVWAFYTKDADGTDNNAIRVIGKASAGITANGNDHSLSLAWDTANNRYDVRSLSNGTEVARTMRISIRDDASNDAVDLNNIEIMGQSKTHASSTGDAGGIVLTPGVASGSGAQGFVNVNGLSSFNGVASFNVAPVAKAASGYTLDLGTSTAPFNIFEGRTDWAAFQTQKTGSEALWAFFTKDSDGTDNNAIRIVGKGSPAANGDDHSFSYGWSASQDRYNLRSLSNGAEKARAVFFSIRDDNTADAAAGNDMSLQAQNRTGGTGNGGNILLTPGTSSGGTKGYIDASSSLIKNVTDPTSAQDAATKNYVDTNAVLLSGANTGIVRSSQQSTTTTDATVTTNYTLALSNNTVYQVEAFCVARRTDAADRASYKVVVTAYREAAGAATLQGSETDLHIQESDASWDGSFAVSGNNLLFQVTGAAAKTINWKCGFKYEIAS